MALTKTEGIILRRIRLRETSKILTVLTPDYGKIKLVAKGARKPKHRFGSGMEPFTVCSIVFYHRENRDLQLVSQCDTTQDFPEFTGDLHRLAYGSAVLEMADKIVLESESSADVFALVVEAVSLMSQAPVGELPVIWWGYQLKLAALSGYGPQLGCCESCGREVRGRTVLFAPGEGGVRCESCRIGGEHSLSGGGQRALQFLAQVPLEELRSLRVSRTQAGEIENFLSRFLVSQFGDSARIRSLGVMGTGARTGDSRRDFRGIADHGFSA